MKVFYTILKWTIYNTHTINTINTIDNLKHFWINTSENRIQRTQYISPRSGAASWMKSAQVLPSLGFEKTDLRNGSRNAAEKRDRFLSFKICCKSVYLLCVSLTKKTYILWVYVLCNYSYTATTLLLLQAWEKRRNSKPSTEITRRAWDKFRS